VLVLLGAADGLAAQNLSWLFTTSQTETTQSGSGGTVLQTLRPNEVARLEHFSCPALSAEKWGPTTCYQTMAGDADNNGDYYDPVRFGTIDALLDFPNPVLGCRSQRTLFWSPSRALPTSVSGLPGMRPGDAARIVRIGANEGQVEYFLRVEDLQLAMGMTTTPVVDLDAIAADPAYGAFFSLDATHTVNTICGVTTVQDGDLLVIPASCITWTPDFRVTSVIPDCAEVGYTEAQMDAMVANAQIQDRFGTCLTQIIDLEAPDIDCTGPVTAVVSCPGTAIFVPTFVFSGESMTGAGLCSTQAGGIIHADSCRVMGSAVRHFDTDTRRSTRTPTAERDPRRTKSRHRPHLDPDASLRAGTEGPPIHGSGTDLDRRPCTQPAQRRPCHARAAGRPPVVDLHLLRLPRRLHRYVDLADSGTARLLHDRHTTGDGAREVGLAGRHSGSELRVVVEHTGTRGRELNGTEPDRELLTGASRWWSTRRRYGSRMHRTALVTAVVCLLLSAIAPLPHDTWLLALHDSDGAITLSIRVGMDFPESVNSIPAERLRGAVIDHEGNVSPIGGWQSSTEADRTESRVGRLAPGLHIAFVDTQPRLLEMSVRKFNDYLLHDGLWPVLAEGPIAGFDRATGQRFEIIPLENPLTAKSSDSLRVRVVFDGAPLVRALLCWDHPGNGEDFTGTTFTDAMGEAIVPLTRPGLTNFDWSV
jgi:hypothetical protein